MSGIEALVDHLFRREAGKMVSTLVRILGFRNVDVAEDVVQDALLRALEVWQHRGVPENPSAWLFQAARNRALDLHRCRLT
jgi:RNA polymerase sigma-70 factor (ECF subfamily)